MARRSGGLGSTIAAALCVAVTAGAAAGSGPPFPGGACLVTAWAPDVSELCGPKGWGVLRDVHATHDPEFDHRLSCTEEAPGGGAALDVVAWGDKANSLLDYRRQVPGMGADAARMTAQIYVADDYELWSAGRLLLGLRIGDPVRPGKGIGGNIAPEKQTGSSVRVNFAAKGDRLVPKLLGYYLDRQTKAAKHRSNWTGKTKMATFGENTRVSGAIPKGEWVTLVLDVVLNDVGQSNGSATLTVLDASGQVLGSGTRDNAVFRNDASWKIIGPYMTEKYNKSGPAPKTQHMFYRDYAISVPDGRASDCS
jgi:hypothetical protein